MIVNQGGPKQFSNARHEAEAIFRRQLGITSIDSILEQVGNQEFLKFIVGRPAPAYEKALNDAQKILSEDNPFRGLLGLEQQRGIQFPRSPEAHVLLSTLTRCTRHIVLQSGRLPEEPTYVPFQGQEDDKIIQPANHLIVGRRGVGKSTLISQGMHLLRETPDLPVVMDMQAYADATDVQVFGDILSDLVQSIRDAACDRLQSRGHDALLADLGDFATRTLEHGLEFSRAAPDLKRRIAALTKALGGDLFIFLDDYHLLTRELQPRFLHLLHGAFKGAGAWLKVAGIRSLMNPYDPSQRKGLQVPGDAQQVSLDFTLVDPDNAESHLRAILEGFLRFVGYSETRLAIMESAFQRLVWANAGVPRDFLQMFARSLEHAARSNRPKITMTDANLAIGEFGQQKMNDLREDARNDQDTLQQVVEYLAKHCLDEHKINAFLVRSEHSAEQSAVQALSDLRIVHLIHPTITPHKAGERYEAYLLDYSLFTGFRRRPNITEMRPTPGHQFKASELRGLPTLPKGFLSSL